MSFGVAMWCFLMGNWQWVVLLGTLHAYVDTAQRPNRILCLTKQLLCLTSGPITKCKTPVQNISL